MKGSEHVHWTLNRSVAIVTIDDGKANAFTPEIFEALLGALDACESQAKAIVLSGRPGSFSAGIDLEFLLAGKDLARMLALGTQAILRLAEYPRPVVVACTGHALTTGAALLLCCDIRLGAPGDYRIGFNDVAMGVPVTSMVYELAQMRLSPRHLVRACNTARLYSPESAVDAGFLDSVVYEDLSAEALAVATGLADRLDQRAFAATRRLTTERLSDVIKRTSSELARFSGFSSDSLQGRVPNPATQVRWHRDSALSFGKAQDDSGLHDPGLHGADS